MSFARLLGMELYKMSSESVYKILKKAKKPMSIQEIYEAHERAISQQSIKKNLRLLLEKGKIEEISGKRRVSIIKSVRLFQVKPK